jgi:hypothetical protein
LKGNAANSTKAAMRDEKKLTKRKESLCQVHPFLVGVSLETCVVIREYVVSSSGSVPDCKVYKRVPHGEAGQGAVGCGWKQSPVYRQWFSVPVPEKLSNCDHGGMLLALMPEQIVATRKPLEVIATTDLTVKRILR